MPLLKLWFHSFHWPVCNCSVSPCCWQRSITFRSPDSAVPLACIFTVALILCVLLDAVDQSSRVPSLSLHVVFNPIGIAPGPLCFLFSPSRTLFARYLLVSLSGALLKCHLISVVFPSACIENSTLFSKRLLFSVLAYFFIPPEPLL